MVKMNDLSKTKSYLNLALKNLPQKDKNVSIKKMIQKTIVEIEYLQKKSVNTNKAVRNYENEWKEKMEKIALELTNPEASIEAIEKMIQQEEEKIKEIENSKNNNKLIID